MHGLALKNQWPRNYTGYRLRYSLAASSSSPPVRLQDLGGALLLQMLLSLATVASLGVSLGDFDIFVP